MGTAYLIASSGLFTLEIVFQLYAIAEHSKTSQALFVALLAVVMAPLLLVNFVSAIQVTKTHDFSGKNCGRVICIIFHALQLGVIWRSLKMLILFEDKDWEDFLRMRLFHCGFHSLPFAIVLTYSMFVNDFAPAMFVLAVSTTMLSASVALTTYQTGRKLYEPADFGKRRDKIRKHVGLALLCISTLLLLISRCSSIVLFSVAETYWIFLPLSMHLIFHFIYKLIKLSHSDEPVLLRIATTFNMSFVWLFEMIRTDYKGVKCSYVFFYTIMLIENLTFGFYWMLTANYAEMLKLMTVLVVLLSFLVGVTVKFASSGCIYNIESDILTDAFTNPELKHNKEGTEMPDKLNTEQTGGNSFDTSDNTFRKMEIEVSEAVQISSPVSGSNPPSVSKKSKHSKPGSSSVSSADRSREYHNHAFVHSQGTLSALSEKTPQGSRHSRESEKRSKHSGKRERHRHGRSLQRGFNSQEEYSQNNATDALKPPLPMQHRNGGNSNESDQITVSDGLIRRSMIKVSDKSIHGGPKESPLPVVNNMKKASNADLASSNSRYSRNTHTLQSSVRSYGYNGFDDPYREKRVTMAANRSKRKGKYRQTHIYGLHKHNLGSIYSNPDHSLDSSELYPSFTSDTSSMTSNTRDYSWDISRHRKHSRNRMQDIYDGYLTDVSNSDDVSFTDYSLDDSCSCSESSDSEGAVTWPPSHVSNLADMYNIPDKVSSTDNIIHWLETMMPDASLHGSFSTLPDPSVASDTDMSLSALQTFEVKKEHKRFRKLLPKPKEVFLKFRSLNYKDKQRQKQARPYPLKQVNGANNSGPPAPHRTHLERSPLASVPLPVDSIQESIV